jgi:hypothetical protein
MVNPPSADKLVNRQYDTTSVIIDAWRVNLSKRSEWANLQMGNEVTGLLKRLNDRYA